jgi:hypothetical protein
MEPIWVENDLARKRATVFTEIIAHGDPEGDPRWRGGRSVYVKLLTAKGFHIATLHETVLPDDSVPHSHLHDYTFRDCTRVRCPDPNDPP